MELSRISPFPRHSERQKAIPRIRDGFCFMEKRTGQEERPAKTLNPRSAAFASNSGAFSMQ